MTSRSLPSMAELYNIGVSFVSNYYNDSSNGSSDSDNSLVMSPVHESSFKTPESESPMFFKFDLQSIREKKRKEYYKKRRQLEGKMFTPGLKQFEGKIYNSVLMKKRNYFGDIKNSTIMKRRNKRSVML